MIKQAVIDAAQSLDAELLRLLMSHDALKRHFFEDVDGVMVFDKVKLLRFVSNKAFLEDSYTAFKNKIGLATKNADGTYDAYLSDNKDVVLAYPYKDCMLKAGRPKKTKNATKSSGTKRLPPTILTASLPRKHSARCAVTPPTAYRKTSLTSLCRTIISSKETTSWLCILFCLYIGARSS